MKYSRRNRNNVIARAASVACAAVVIGFAFVILMPHRASAPERIPLLPAEEDLQLVAEPSDGEPGGGIDGMPGSVDGQALPTIPEGAEFVSGVVLVSVADGTDAAQLSALLEQSGCETVAPGSARMIVGDVAELQVVEGSSVEDAVRELGASGVVAGAQPDYIYHVDADDSSTYVAGGSQLLQALSIGANDTYANKQWNLESINAPGAWSALGSSARVRQSASPSSIRASI